jgi:hypothetical protein
VSSWLYAWSAGVLVIEGPELLGKLVLWNEFPLRLQITRPQRVKQAAQASAYRGQPVVSSRR